MDKSNLEGIEPMKFTGVDLIAIERDKQIKQLGFTPERDAHENPNKELVQAAVFVLTGNPDDYPENWGKHYFVRSIHQKGNSPEATIDKLVTAGALIAAEIDRLLLTNS